jgi:hypothetical protein
VFDGVYAMQRGMGECVELFPGIPAARANSPAPDSARWVATGDFVLKRVP